MSTTDTTHISASSNKESPLTSAMASLNISTTNNITTLASKESIFDGLSKHINIPLTPASNEASPVKSQELLTSHQPDTKANLLSPPSSPLLSVQDHKLPTSNSFSIKQQKSIQSSDITPHTQLEPSSFSGHQYIHNNNISYNNKGRYTRRTNLNTINKYPADHQHTYAMGSFLRNHPAQVRPTWFAAHNHHPASLYHSIPTANIISNPTINTGAFTTPGTYRYPTHVQHPSISSVYSSSSSQPPTPLSPQIAGMIASGPPVPAPVPSIFSGPAYYDTLESSLQNPNKTTNVYIRGLPPDTTDESLYILASRFGKIHSSKAILDTQSGTCKGFGFAWFEEEEEAKACIAGLMHFGYQVSFAKESFSTRLKNLADPGSTNLYLSNLPLNMHEKDLEEQFAPYKVISNRILRDSNNVSRGVGFARMSDREAADAIIENFDGKKLPGAAMPLQVRYADSPSQKRLKGQTVSRRLWRAREYNVLTGRSIIDDSLGFSSLGLGIDHYGIQHSGTGITDVHNDPSNSAAFSNLQIYFPISPGITGYPSNCETHIQSYIWNINHPYISYFKHLQQRPSINSKPKSLPETSSLNSTSVPSETNSETNNEKSTVVKEKDITCHLVDNNIQVKV
ncbi:hypothetical protein T552_01697 [Pneumocystis carinii B80]|uniref:RRM domain-containing protein n=1 Tax=Pneumocystis carinii (strain B80) TaxID=1408658 RepID=A0A0W4ZJ86_PNEC8|nr:hypothetical protein T552_01697 [Pneumocystis carinii B80]KTW28434.1 hypothetical protein T552_01697 [Pneumocystis carinii B80]